MNNPQPHFQSPNEYCPSSVCDQLDELREVIDQFIILTESLVDHPETDRLYGSANTGSLFRKKKTYRNLKSAIEQITANPPCMRNDRSIDKAWITAHIALCKNCDPLVDATVAAYEATKANDDASTDKKIFESSDRYLESHNSLGMVFLSLLKKQTVVSEQLERYDVENRLKTLDL